MSYLQAFLGLLIFIGLPYVLSENKKAIPWKKVGGGLLLALGLAFLLTQGSGAAAFFLWLNKGVGVIDSVTQRASGFVFGYLGGGEAPFEVVKPEFSFIIAFRVLPLILVVTVLSNILFYLGVLPFLINLFSKLIKKLFGISSALAFGAAATVFLGTIESPLIVKPYLSRFSRGELFALISCSMATIAGSVMVLYASTLAQTIPNALGHLMVASLISVPTALSLSFILIPLSENSIQEVVSGSATPYYSLFDAIITGIQEGLTMVLQIAATLLVLFALVYLANDILSLLPHSPTLEGLLGLLFRPVVWLLGIPWGESEVAGNLMGIKVILNEFVAYLSLPTAKENLSPKSLLIMTYALCGFANFGSVGIIVGGLSAIVPERKKEIGELALKSLLLGNLATLITGLLVGLVS